MTNTLTSFISQSIVNGHCSNNPLIRVEEKVRGKVGGGGTHSHLWPIYPLQNLRRGGGGAYMGNVVVW